MRNLFLTVATLILTACVCPSVSAQSETPVAAESPAPAADEAPTPRTKEDPKPRVLLGGLLRIPVRGQHVRPGADFTLFAPASGAMRDRFGSSWQGFGFGFGRVEVPQARSVLDTETGWLSSSKGSNRVTLIPLGVRWRTAFGASNNRPFIGVGGGLLVSETRVPSENLPSRWRGGATGSAFAGIAFGGNGSVQVGYRWADRIRGFDMSGSSLDFAVRF
ncbi:MAG: hypothetical protein H7145_15575 [Akkermansiaceae bacterium]|nr:hypothetical protein [Armatimonadota bacterium]